MLTFINSVTTKILTTAELGIACDPPLTFEVKTYLTRETLALLACWDDDSDNPVLTKQVAARLFVSVQQDGEKFPLDSEAAISGLAQAIGPDGMEFVGAMVRGFEALHFGFFMNASKRSKLSPAHSENGLSEVSSRLADELAN